MRANVRLVLFAVLLLSCASAGARAETPEEWVKLGARVHGGFGSFIPVGIRIGEDAMKRLNAQPRELVGGLLQRRRRALPLLGRRRDAGGERKPRPGLRAGRGREIAARHVRGRRHPPPQGRRRPANTPCRCR